MNGRIHPLAPEAQVPFTEEHLTRIAALAHARRASLQADIEVGSERARRDYRVLFDIELRATAALVKHFPTNDEGTAA